MSMAKRELALISVLWPSLIILSLSDANPLTRNPLRPELKGSKEDDVVLPLKRSELKRDWCLGRSFMQEVKHEGCKTQSVKNKFCFGQCTTFFIPRHRFNSFHSCSQCVPVHQELVEVKLECHDGIKKKRVNVIKRCGCRSCGYADFAAKATP